MEMRLIMDSVGYTSITLARLIAHCMGQEGVPDNTILVTKHFFVRNKRVAEKMKEKYIYIAYDGESLVDEGSIWDEVGILKSNTPELIITVSKNAYDFYKSLGFNTYYCKIGYDDVNYKELDIKRDNVVGCAWSMDEERHSTFYHRYIISKDVSAFLNFKNIYKYVMSNKIPYHELNKIYSSSLLGLNDVIRHPNQRCFEIPVNGSVMLVNSEIINTDYPLKEGRHYIVYESIMNLLNIIEEYMNNEEKTIKMGERARKEALKYPQSKYVREMVDRLGLR